MKYTLLPILLLSGVALAGVTVKGSKSNTSFKETKVTCKTLECCQQHPNSSGCVGSVLRVECPECKTTKTKAQIEFEKNSGHATEKAITVKGSKSNASEKEAEPTPRPRYPVGGAEIGASRSNNPEPTPATEKAVTMGRDNLKPMQPKGSTTVKGSTQTTSFKEAEPTPAASTTSEKAIVKSKSNITNNRDVVPTPTPTPAANKVKVKPAEPVHTTDIHFTMKDVQPTPTPKPVGNINLNSSRSNKD